MTAPIRFAIAAFLLVAGVAADASAEPPPISLATMRDRAKSGLGYSYWWGGSRWDPNSHKCPGSCSGFCGACSHRASPSGCPEYGADCSGYTGKVWMTSESLRSLTSANHPYVAASWTGSNSNWTRISSSSTRAGDIRATSTHVVFVWDRSPNGSIATTEAQCCRCGIRRDTRSVGDGYVSTRRRNATAGPTDSPPAKATTPTGPGAGRPGDRLHYCASARDPEKDKIGIEFLFAGGGKRVVVRTRLAKAGSTMCVTHPFGRAGNYEVTARGFENVKKNGRSVRVYGPRSGERKVKIGDDAVADSRAPVPKSPTNGKVVKTARPSFKWTRVAGPPVRDGQRIDLRYDLQVFAENPRTTRGAKPVFAHSVRPGAQLRVSGDSVTWTPPDSLRDFLPAGKRTFWWRVRACFWADCTPFSSSVGAKRYATFKLDPSVAGCTPDGGLPASCAGVFDGGEIVCEDNSDCPSDQRCILSASGMRCGKSCVTDFDCTLSRCLPTRDLQGAAGRHCVIEYGNATQCFCDLENLPPACPSNDDHENVDWVDADWDFGPPPPASGRAPQFYFREYVCR